MSSDNSIIIAKFPDGYRVVHCQAAENISYYEVGTKKRKETLDEYFGGTPVYMSKDVAMRKALDMEEEILEDCFGMLEYGISYIGSFNYVPILPLDN